MGGFTCYSASTLCELLSRQSSFAIASRVVLLPCGRYCHHAQHGFVAVHRARFCGRYCHHAQHVCRSTVLWRPLSFSLSLSLSLSSWSYGRIIVPAESS